MVFLVRLFLFIVRISFVCLVLNFHPKTDAETKLESRTHNAKVCDFLLQGTAKCSEIGRDKRAKSERNRSKSKNREENGSATDFIGLPMSAHFFFEGYASGNYHWRENLQKMSSNQRKDTERP